jgi:hypothetical protein
VSQRAPSGVAAVGLDRVDRRFPLQQLEGRLNWEPERSATCSFLLHGFSVGLRVELGSHGSDR